MKKFTAFLLSVLFVAVGALGCSNGTKEEYKKTTKGTPQPVYKVHIDNIDDDVMPIAGFIGFPKNYTKNGYSFDSVIRDDVFEKLQQAGVNLVFDNSYNLNALDDDTIKMLELGEKYGVNFVFQDRAVAINSSSDPNANFVASQEEFNERMAFWDEFPAYVGLYVRDEPSLRIVDGVAETQKRVKEANRVNGRNYVTYMNLYPPASGTTLSGTGENLSYTDYVAAFAETEPPFMMYDLYPFAGSEGIVNTSWYSNLNRFREAANKIGVPYFVHLQTGGEWPDAKSLRVTNEKETLWMVNSAIALGAKGICWFTLFIPPGHVQTIADPHYQGLINQWGTANPTYYYALKAAKQVRAIDEVIMNSASMGIMFSGSTPSPLTGTYILKEFRELKSVSGESCAVGCFDYKGGTALYLYNNSILEASDCTLNFSDNYGYDIIRRGEKDFLTGKSLTFNLEAGEGVLIVLR